MQRLLTGLLPLLLAACFTSETPRIPASALSQPEDLSGTFWRLSQIESQEASIVSVRQNLDYLRGIAERHGVSLGDDVVETEILGDVHGMAIPQSAWGRLQGATCAPRSWPTCCAKGSSLRDLRSFRRQGAG